MEPRGPLPTEPCFFASRLFPKWKLITSTPPLPSLHPTYPALTPAPTSAPHPHLSVCTPPHPYHNSCLVPPLSLPLLCPTSAPHLPLPLLLPPPPPLLPTSTPHPAHPTSPLCLNNPNHRSRPGSPAVEPRPPAACQELGQHPDLNLPRPRPNPHLCPHPHLRLVPPCPPGPVALDPRRWSRARPVRVRAALTATPPA